MPLWKLLLSLSDEQLVDLLDLTYLDDALVQLSVPPVPSFLVKMHEKRLFNVENHRKKRKEPDPVTVLLSLSLLVS